MSKIKGPDSKALNAFFVVEGLTPSTPAEKLEAWQYLVDSGLVWSLQGSYGREAQSLINQGLIKDKPEKRRQVL